MRDFTQYGLTKTLSGSSITDVRPHGQGVIGLRLSGGDAVAGCAIIGLKNDLIITTSRGKAKLTDHSHRE